MNISKVPAVVLAVFLLFSAYAQGESLGMLAADGAHILALDGQGCVWAWGSNQKGESAPDNPDQQILTPVSVFSGAKMIAAGQQFSMALSENGELFMWGDNSLGQIPGFEGEATRKSVSVMNDVALIDACDGRALSVTQSGSLLVWGEGLEKKTLMEGVKSAAMGVDFVLALTQDGDVYEFIDGEEGKVTLTGCSGIDAFGQSRYAITADGRVYAWGANSTEGRLGLPNAYDWAEEPVLTALTDIRSVKSGLTVGGAINADGAMYMWGTVYSYLTGYDEETGEMAALMDAELIHYGNAPILLYEGVRDAAFGDAFIAVLFENGDVYAWGSNDHGQMGDGTLTVVQVVEGDEEGEYELEVRYSSQHVFPACPIRLEF